KGLGTLVTGFCFKHLRDRKTFRLYSGTRAGLLVVDVLFNLLMFKSSRTDKYSLMLTFLVFKYCKLKINNVPADIRPPFGSLVPFIALFMETRGLTRREIGVSLGVMPFVGVFVSPSVGAIADRWNIHKYALMVCTLFAGAVHLLLLAIPARAHPLLVVESHLSCSTSSSYFQDCELSPSPSVHTSGSYQKCQNKWTNFAATVGKIKKERTYSEADLNCESRCSKHKSSGNVIFCFSDEPEDFVRQCSGTIVLQDTITFCLKNMSHVLGGKALADQRNKTCKKYDIEGVEMDEVEYRKLLCDKTVSLNCTTSCKEPPSELCPFQAKEFDDVYLQLILTYLLANIFLNPCFCLSDAVTFDILGDERYKYGKQRLWGTCGFAVFGLVSTAIMEQAREKGGHLDLSPAFYIFAALCCCSAAIASFMRLHGDVSCGRNMFSHCLELFTDVEVLAFLLVVLHMGMGLGVQQGFLFLYLKQEFSASPILFGLCLFANASFEVKLP
ncbi:hypothetical protein BaRGS_00025814, partial [Batillaria attramentaria]